MDSGIKIATTESVLTGLTGTPSGGSSQASVFSNGYRFVRIAPDSNPLILGTGKYSIVSNYSGSDKNGNEAFDNADNIRSNSPAGFQVTTTSSDGFGGSLSFVGLGRYDSGSSLDFPAQDAVALDGHNLLYEPFLTAHVFGAGSLGLLSGEGAPPIPEPATLVSLFCGGLVLLGAHRLQRKSVN